MKVYSAYLPILCTLRIASKICKTQVPKRSPIAGITYTLKHSWVQIEHVSESESESASATSVDLVCARLQSQLNWVELRSIELSFSGGGRKGRCGMGRDTGLQLRSAWMGPAGANALDKNFAHVARTASRRYFYTFLSERANASQFKHCDYIDLAFQTFCC